MNSKLLALTFLMFSVGCNQGSSGLKQKPIPQKNAPVAIDSNQSKEVPTSMTRGSGSSSDNSPLGQEAQGSGSQVNAPAPVVSGPNSTTQTTTIPNSSSTAQTIKVETGSTASNEKTAPVTTSQGETKTTSIGSLDVRTGPVKPPAEAPEAKKEHSEKPEENKAGTTATTAKQDDSTAAKDAVASPIDEKKAASSASQRLDTKAKSAEDSKDDKRTPEEKEHWQNLIDYVADHGETSDSQMGYYVSLKDETSEDRYAPRVANYISIVGGPGDNGSFVYSRAEAVWENWKKNEDGKLDGDQYMFLLSRNGNIAQSWHYHFIKDTDDHVLLHQSLPLTAEAAQAKWDEMRQTWYKKIQGAEAETKK